MDIICGDNRFEIIARAKKHLLDATNIETDEAEMAVIDNILFRCWQMGWLERYDRKDEPQTERRGRVMKTCGDCVNCEKVHPKYGKEFWACEEYGILLLGMPADVTPPNDEPCEFWTNDPKQKNKNYNAIMKLF